MSDQRTSKRCLFHILERRYFRKMGRDGRFNDSVRELFTPPETDYSVVQFLGDADDSDLPLVPVPRLLEGLLLDASRIYPLAIHRAEFELEKWAYDSHPHIDRWGCHPDEAARDRAYVPLTQTECIEFLTSRLEYWMRNQANSAQVLTKLRKSKRPGSFLSPGRFLWIIDVNWETREVELLVSNWEPDSGVVPFDCVATDEATLRRIFPPGSHPVRTK